MQAYFSRKICLTTRHGKHRALALPFRLGLGAELHVCDLDTDQLGTFSGEIHRMHEALETCRIKARMGMSASGLPIGIASEASFGPHPAMPMLAVGQELLIFLDLERDLCVLEQRLEWRTNYSQTLLESDDQLAPWLAQVKFPSHAVIARPETAQVGVLLKGLNTSESLAEAISVCRAADPDGRVWLETDMRAHCNPTRMRSIRRLGSALVRRLRNPCPECGSPGWGLLDTQPGLPCSDCGTATELTLSEIWGCQQCGARREHPRRDGRIQADPGQCPWCNP
ncbi:MAG: hypothetical protein H9532_15065 [Vulcanococcus sp. Clear-D1]|nr:hypothetical protein [Vulcanococcus sp. Clear-D1]